MPTGSPSVSPTGAAISTSQLEMDATVNASFWFVLAFIPHSISHAVIKGEVPFTLWYASLVVFGSIAWQNLQTYEIAPYWLGTHFALIVVSHLIERVFESYDALLRFKNGSFLKIVVVIAVSVVFVTYDLVISFTSVSLYSYNTMVAQVCAAAVVALFLFSFICSSPAHHLVGGIEEEEEDGSGEIDGGDVESEVW